MYLEDNRIYRIALDAMGGDFAPTNEILGAINLFDKKVLGNNVEIIFVGNERKIRSTLEQYDISRLNYSIVNAEEVINMNDDLSSALKKKDSSLHIGLSLVNQRLADAFVSAGNTGAVLSASTLVLGRIKGVHRPTIGQQFPSKRKYPSLLLDVGANIDCNPRYLYEFAVMGSIYVNQILGIENPRIALLNIGEESSKGTEVIQQTFALLKNSQLNFIGNIEGRDILSGDADVIVCDGFIGNIVLKFAESVGSYLKYQFKSFASKFFLNKLLMLFTIPVLRKIFKQFDYQEYGGVPLLGVNGVVIIGHGKSSPRAIMKMLQKAIEFVQRDINTKIERALNIQIVKENA
jgi:glycerol-3-phosphate acyltransferase PlsX